MCDTPVIPALRAEWTKALTLRSIRGTLAAALLVPPALALGSALAVAGRAQAVPVAIESQGFQTAGFGQPLIILLAALVAGTEYNDGQLRTTLISTPAGLACSWRRRR